MADSDSNKTTAIGVWACYLASVIVGITAIIGVIIAYVKKEDVAGTVFDSHLVYARRTFWIGLIGGLAVVIVAVVLTLTVVLTPVAWLLLLGFAVWWLYRGVKGLMKALDSKPIDNPLSYF